MVFCDNFLKGMLYKMMKEGRNAVHLPRIFGISY